MLRPTGNILHFSDFAQQPDGAVDGLVLNVQGRADGRIAPLDNERVRGYFERLTPDAMLDFEYNQFTPGFGFRAAAFPGHDFTGFLQMDSSRRQFTGRSDVFVGSNNAACDLTLDIAPRMPAAGQPASQTFDVTLNVQPCVGEQTEANPAGEYTGWAAVDAWVEDPFLSGGRAVCALVGVVTRTSDGFSFPFYLSGQVNTSQPAGIECRGTRF